MEKAIPEVVLKKRERAKRELEYRKNAIKKIRKNNKERRNKSFKRAIKYSIIYKNEEKNLLEQKKRAIEKNCFYLPPAPKLALIVRIRGLKNISPKPKKVLQLFRLKRINNAVFVRINPSTTSLLKIIEPFVAWGYPTLETIKNLVYKRGFVRINGQRIALTENSLIEEKLGEKNIICCEDLIHQIYTVGENFKFANNFLWPFHLKPPKGGYRSIKRHFIVGGSFGNREEYINDLVETMI